MVVLLRIMSSTLFSGFCLIIAIPLNLFISDSSCNTVNWFYRNIIKSLNRRVGNDYSAAKNDDGLKDPPVRKRIILVGLAACFGSVLFVALKNAYYNHGGLGLVLAVVTEAVFTAIPIVFASYIRPSQEYSTSFCIIYTLICTLRLISVCVIIYGGNSFYFDYYVGVYSLNFAFIMHWFGKDWEEEGAQPTFAKYVALGIVLLAISNFLTPISLNLAWLVYAIAALYLVVFGIAIMFFDRPLDKEQRKITDEDGNEKDYPIRFDGYYFGVSYRSLEC